MLAIARRELASFFRLPLGWIVIALFTALSAVVFTSRVLVPGEPASMRPFFSVWWSLLLFIAPAVSMRLFSEEHRSGTIEPLLTSPLSEAAIVAGKFLAALAFLVALLLPSLAFVAILFALSRPDPGPIAAGYLGILLTGALYLAVGTLASALTSSQSLAFLATLMLFLAVDAVAALAAPALPRWAATLVFAISPSLRLADFAKGVIDTAHVAFFLLASLWFLALTWLALASRRWR